jgi:hypothetical protein
VPGGFEILRDGTPAGLRLTGVEPAEGTICGGLEVLLRGEGFLPGLQVSFGQIPAAEVELVDGRSARVTTPAVAEGTGPVTISAVIGAGERVNLGSPFRYLPAAPPFLRGDVNEDGAIGITDVILLADLILGKGDDLPANLDAADANDDGAVNGGDVTRLMNALFGGGDDLPPPFPPGAAALDPTPDALTSCP